MSSPPASTSTTSIPFGIAAYSIEVSSTPGRVDIYLYGQIGPAAAEHLEVLLAMVEAVDTPVRVDLSGVSSLDAGGLQPLIGLASTRRAAGRAGVFIAASNVLIRRQLDLMSVNLPAFDRDRPDESLARS